MKLPEKFLIRVFSQDEAIAVQLRLVELGYHHPTWSQQSPEGINRDTFFGFPVVITVGEAGPKQFFFASGDYNELPEVSAGSFVGGTWTGADSWYDYIPCTQHDWVETNTLRTGCRHCDAPAVWDRETLAWKEAKQ